MISNRAYLTREPQNCSAAFFYKEKLMIREVVYARLALERQKELLEMAKEEAIAKKFKNSNPSLAKVIQNKALSSIGKGLIRVGITLRRISMKTDLVTQKKSLAGKNPG
jgi:hypothetical protein